MLWVQRTGEQNVKSYVGMTFRKEKLSSQNVLIVDSICNRNGPLNAT
jgi:hypothetical protein